MNQAHGDVPRGNILVVDDTPANLRLLSGMLTEQGYKVRIIPNGSLALAAVQAVPPDLILLDVTMPGLNGYEVCQQLKADTKTRDIPVIFISALDEVLDKVKAFGSGGVDYITKPFQLEEVLARVETHLTLRNLHRQYQQANADLQEMNASLKASNQELDAFAHTVAHDLKNPLWLMTGYADLVREDLAKSETPRELILEALENIQQAGQQAIRIVDELLLLAGVRKGRVELGPVDMARVLAQVQQRLAAMLKEYQVEPILPASWPTALGYEPWLEEVWVNYISNGLKYGGQPLRLELGATPQADGQLRFWVRDNGPGLTPQAQTALFTEFTRLDETRAEGHGLGLSIVRRIMEKLGGQVGVESTVGQGSVFFFTLPGWSGSEK